MCFLYTDAPIQINCQSIETSRNPQSETPLNHWLINFGVMALPSCGMQIVPSTGEAARIQPAAGPATDMSAMRWFGVATLPWASDIKPFILQNVSETCAGNRSQT